MKYIIDTNVPKMAGCIELQDILDIKCALSCLEYIQRFMNHPDEKLVLDSNNEIFKEYCNNLNTSGQNNIAIQFLNWVQRHLTLREGSRIEEVYLEKAENGRYINYPKGIELSNFDSSDQKFVALACTHSEHPPIVQGTDCRWWKFKQSLNNNGVSVIFLCLEYVSTKRKGC